MQQNLKVVQFRGDTQPGGGVGGLIVHETNSYQNQNFPNSTKWKVSFVHIHHLVYIGPLYIYIFLSTVEKTRQWYRKM